jgi:hypothetical protein
MHESDAPPFPVDAVFTWVNGSEPNFLELLKNSSKSYNGTEASMGRFRDIGQLRYGMRSIWMHAPWIRRIILVVSDRANQTPKWLNASHPSISVVEHKEIWEEPSLLPTFSSGGIEPNLHRIPGISEVFLFLNDDLFIAQRLTKDSFWTRPHEQILCDAWGAPRPENKNVKDAYGLSIMHVTSLFNTRYGRPRQSPRVYCHSPIAINTTIWRSILEEWRPQFNAVLRNGPFRTAHDMQLHFTYAEYIKRKKTPRGDFMYPFSIVKDNKCLHFNILSDNPLENNKTFAAILAHPRSFVALQDGLKSPSDNTIQEIIDFHEKILPRCAPWEIDCVEIM